MTTTFATTPEGQQYAGSPLVRVQRTLVSFIQGLFAQCPPGAYHWQSPSERGAQDTDDSEIWIGGESPVNPEQVGKRPAITVARGAAAFQGIGLGDQAFVDLRTGAVARMDMMPVTFSVFVLSRYPVEAEDLGWFVLRHIWSLRDEIMKGNENILYVGNRPSLSPATPAGGLIGGPDTEHNWVAVGITLPVYLQYSSTTMPLNKRILSGMTVTGRQVSEKAPKKTSAFQGTAVFQPELSRGSSLSINNPLISTEASSLPQKDTSDAQCKELLRVQVKSS